MSCLKIVGGGTAAAGAAAAVGEAEAGYYCLVIAVPASSDARR